MLNRWVEDGLLDTLGTLGVGCIAFSPLAQGMLTDRYLDGIPADSRAARGGSLSTNLLTDEALSHIRSLNEIAKGRGQSLAQMALSWALRDPRVTSVLVGASSVQQLEDNLAAVEQPRVRRRRTLRHREARGRLRDQPLEPVQRRLRHGLRPCLRTGRESAGRRQTGPGCWAVVRALVALRALSAAPARGCPRPARRAAATRCRPARPAVRRTACPGRRSRRDRRDPCRWAAGRGAPRARPGRRCRGRW